MAEQATKPTTMKPQELTIKQLFSDYYLVPSYQREYVWEEDNVEQLFADILEEFRQAGNSQQSYYFLGTIIGVETSDGFEVIDGQQRLTTLYVYFCALQRYFAESNDQDTQEDLLEVSGFLRSTDRDFQGKRMVRYRLAPQYEDGLKFIKSVAGGSSETGENDTDPEPTPSLKRLHKAYSKVDEFIHKRIENREELHRFNYYLRERVRVVRIDAGSLPNALRMFEAINSRGVSLDSVDLLKNLLFLNTPRTDYVQISKRWEELVRIIAKTPLRPIQFLRYYVVAHFERNHVEQNRIYTWFQDHAEEVGYESNAEAFVRKLIDCAKKIENYSHDRDNRGNTMPPLKNIRAMTGSLRQHWILLLAAQDLVPDDFRLLCERLEQFLFYKHIVGEGVLRIDHTFIPWAVEFRKIRESTDFRRIMSETIESEIRDLQKRATEAFLVLNQRKLSDRFVKYFLARIAQYLDTLGTGTHYEIETYLKDDLEHIVPRNSSSSGHTYSDEEMERVMRLGNLTLLEPTINRSAAASSWEEKKTKFNRSTRILNRGIVGSRDGVGKETKLAKAYGKVKQFSQFGFPEIDERQLSLLSLSNEIWGIESYGPENSVMLGVNFSPS